ncbi:MAG TPA: hypothetical protein PLV32_13340, partial [Chitinophagaceae bacterium]|nr:hypothetical protein [Chitinophagaceae bacterium]
MAASKRMCIFLFLLVTKFGFAQVLSQPYDYPIKPGSESWQALKTHKEMVQVCQVPEEILQQLTTPALLETCLSYPLLMDVLAFNNLVTGLEQTLKRFNGYHVLVVRPDFAKSLVNY